MNSAGPQQRGERASDDHFDLTCCHGKRHAEFDPYRQALANRVRDIRGRFRFGLTLAHAAGDRGAFGDVGAVFVLVDAHYKLHASILSELCQSRTDAV